MFHLSRLQIDVLIAYTATQYGNMPVMIPTHWGPNGQPDAFSPKTPFSVIALLLILLVTQGMMVGTNALINHAEVGWVGDVTHVKSSILSGVLDICCKIIRGSISEAAGGL